MQQSQPLLNEDEQRFFQENGYFGPFKVYEEEEALDIWKRIRLKLLDNSKQLFTNTKINYDRHFDVTELAAHVSRPEIVNRIQGLIGPDILCWRTEFFSKMQGEPGTEWHQVESYAYASGKAALVPTVRREKTPMELTVWTALSEANKETGCMKFMPGSHKKWYFDEKKSLSPAAEYKDGKKTAFFGYHYAELKIDPNWEPDESQAVCLEMRPGEAVIFTARCMHGSLPNVSKRKMRVAFTSRYAPTDVRIYPDPDDMARDQDSFTEHGEVFDLSRHGSVLVSGADRYKHNRIRTENLIGDRFATLPAVVEAGVL